MIIKLLLIKRSGCRIAGRKRVPVCEREHEILLEGVYGRQDSRKARAVSPLHRHVPRVWPIARRLECNVGYTDAPHAVKHPLVHAARLSADLRRTAFRLLWRGTERRCGRERRES